MRADSQRVESVAQTLAAEISDTAFSDLPQAAWEQSKRLIIDHVGITYMGAALTGKDLLAYAKDLGGRADAVLIGEGTRVPAEIAAGVNGQNCRATNFEESGPGRHIGPLCVHTALAVGQRAHASGRDVLGAVTLGYVLCARFHFAQRADTGLPHHRTVAAAVASRLLGHNAAATAKAMSLAWEFPHRARQGGASRTSPTRFVRKRISPFGTPGSLATPLFHARFGVQSAIMAGFGFESVPDEIDQALDDYDVEQLTQCPIPYHYVDQMELKPWACVRPGQCGIQALSNLVRDNKIDANAVTAVRLHLPHLTTIPHQFEPSPDNYWEAIYSLQWAAAMVLQGVPAGPKWVTEERLADPLSRRLAAAVGIIEDPESSRAYAEFRRSDIRGTAESDVGGQTHRAACNYARDLWRARHGDARGHGRGQIPRSNIPVARPF